ncbi:uncharacterized protein G2W53_017843 [Senna tora]|uniref:Uncharacterized protein n=1 Tax=Senna tora TaxID=362788 RepID=A0A834TZF2_9FABA|nr:uncharacterized protein G2W53_017843 [Senna tora]
MEVDIEGCPPSFTLFAPSNVMKDFTGNKNIVLNKASFYKSILEGSDEQSAPHCSYYGVEYSPGVFEPDVESLESGDSNFQSSRYANGKGEGSGLSLPQAGHPPKSQETFASILYSHNSCLTVPRPVPAQEDHGDVGGCCGTTSPKPLKQASNIFVTSAISGVGEEFSWPAFLAGVKVKIYRVSTAVSVLEPMSRVERYDVSSPPAKLEAESSCLRNKVCLIYHGAICVLEVILYPLPLSIRSSINLFSASIAVMREMSNSTTSST